MTRLFVDEKFLAAVLPVAKEAGLSADRIYLMKEGGVKKAANTGKAKSRKSFRTIIADVRKRKVPAVPIRPATNGTLAYLVFSSGTSGLPKGMINTFIWLDDTQELSQLAVMISHGNLIYSVAQSIVIQQAAAEVYTVCQFSLSRVLHCLTSRNRSHRSRKPVKGFP